MHFSHFFPFDIAIHYLIENLKTMSEVNKEMQPGFIPSGAQNVDAPEPTYRLLEKKVIFPNVDSFLYHWANTFEVKFFEKKMKKGGSLYKLKLIPRPITDPLTQKEFPSNIEYVTFAIEHHNITRDEPTEYDLDGRIHFVVPTPHEENSEIMNTCEQKWVEHEQKKFAVLINKLNAQLSLDFPSDHKRGEYFKELPEYKISMSQFAKFKFEKLVTIAGCTCVDVVFGWIVDDFKDATATQGITLHLNGYKYRPRDANVDIAIANSQRKRKETLEAKKKETPAPEPRKKRCPNLQVEVEEPPTVVAGRYEIISNEVVENEAEKNDWLRLAQKYGVVPSLDIA